MKWLPVAAVVSALLPATAVAQEAPPLYMPGISIIGDQELPKVLYIVPWKNATTTADPAADTPSRRLDDDLLIPLDRDTVRRELRQRSAAASETDFR